MLFNFASMFESRVPQDAYTGELEEAVRAAKEHREWRREYMKLEAMTQRIRWEGRTEGEITKLVSQIYRKAVKGKTPEEITEDLEEELSEVRRIYNVVARYLPEYEPEKILAELKEQTGVRFQKCGHTR